MALERLRVALQDCSVSSRVPELRVAFSAGVAQHDVAAPVQRTLERADQALYQAKAAGRNRCLVSPSDPG